MQIHLYNSLTRTIEPFVPIDADEVRMYTCGPTVYNYVHIGNIRAFLFPELLYRVLQVVGGYKVKWVMNITNIDDRTIQDSAVGSAAWRAEMGEQTGDVKENLFKLTDFYAAAFLRDLETVGIRRSNFYAIPLATDYIPQMQELVHRIVQAGFAYVSNGSVYFDVSAWREADTYGKLINIDFENFQEGVRIDSDKYERDQATDFVLWKGRKENEPYWEFEVDGQNCDGRPGWHIECSAMEAEILGLPFDIHTGGVDLKFPHHEDEIAQSKAGYGVEPTRMWCHNEFLEVEGEKMSKSLGNFFTLQDLLDRNIDPLDIRYLMFSAHYSSRLNFTFAGLESGRKARLRIQEYIYALFDEIDGTDGGEVFEVQEMRLKVFRDLADNLNTAKAISHVFTFMNEHPAGQLSALWKADLVRFFTELNRIYDIWILGARPVEELVIPADILSLAESRLEAKKARNFAEADRLRVLIANAGFTVKDHKEGYSIEKV
jgi:cysteinyl-tRNA synthetase